MKNIKPGDVGYLIQHKKYAGINQKGETKTNPQFVYVGSQSGAGVRHLIFKSLVGNYTTTVAEIDFLIGDIIFTPNPQEKPKHKKRMRSFPILPDMSHHNILSSAFNKGGFA